MQKKFLATAAVASTLGGAVAGATLLAPGFAGAQEDTNAPAPAEEMVRPEPGARITAALQGLVDDGTLTDAQVEAVVNALSEARGELGEGRGGPRGHDRGFGGGGDLAEILGLEQDALREAVMGGQSLADIAAEQGVDTQDLVDAIVSATEERVNGALESGRIDQEKADEIIGGAEDRAEAMLNGEFEGPRGPRGPGGHNGPDAGPDTDA